MRGVRHLVAALVLVTPACGEGGRAVACDETTTVRLEDHGRTVDVQECDLVQLRLGPPSSGDNWVVVRFPDRILQVEREDPVAGDFLYRATATGEGRIELVARDCPPPLPAGEEAAAVPCPVGGPPDGDERVGATRAPLVDGFALTVRVVAA